MTLITSLDNLHFFSFHGMYPQEKINGGKYTVDIWLEQDLPNDSEFKNIDNLIDYEIVYGLIKHEMYQAKDFIEDVAKSIINAVQHNMALPKNIVSIKIKITKHNPAGKFDGGNASVTLNYKIPLVSLT